VEDLVSGAAADTRALFGRVFEGRRVLVTGHTGFKGSWLCEWLLSLGAEVSGFALGAPTEPSLFHELGLADRLARHEIGDVRDLEALAGSFEAASPEVVFHLAAQALVRRSYEQPVDTYATNVMGTVNVLEAVRGSDGVRAVVNVTSDKCYENRETGQAYCETDALGGWDPYSSSKGCAELVTAAYRRSFFGEGSPVRIASVRAGNVIGGGDWAADRIVPDCIRSLTKGEPILVRNPDAVRPWQHVLEPLSGYLHLASRLIEGGPEFDGAWNFGPQEHGTVRVREVVDAIVDAWGSGSWETLGGIVEQPHEARLLSLDVSKSRGALGWRPLYGVASAVRMTADWYAARHAGSDPGALTRGQIDGYVDEAVRQRAVWTSGSRGTGERLK
jgi:CDP-glucose 4,6-dehydratase